ncbi:MAG: anti-sigma factor [Miltoncostaeaceae bacterium]
MTDHDEIRDLLAAVALGSATPTEVARIELLAEADPELADELAGLRAAAGTLALDVPQVDPPPSLRENLMAEVRKDADVRAELAGARPTRSSAPERAGLFGRMRAWPAVAAVAGVAALGLLAWNITLQSDDDPGIQTISVMGSPDAPGAGAEARVLPDGSGAILTVTNLPEPPRGRQYELWLVRGTEAVSGGFLPEGDVAFAAVAVTDLADVTSLAITAEPPVNTTAPTAPPVVEVPLSTT